MINKAILVGYVGQDPDIRKMTSGDEMASFSLATSERWKDKEGERKEATTWHRVVCFQEGLVGVIKSYVKKGSKLYVEGQITQRKWDDNGVEKTMYEINVKSKGKIILLDKQGGGGETPPDSAYE